MNANESGPNRPLPKPPATGADAWKNKPTNCWPTPANMAAAREFSSPLDPNYGSDDDGDVPADEVADEEAEASWEGDGGADEDARPSLSDDGDVPARFRETVTRLDEVPQRPVSEHAESYDAVHKDLRHALDDIER